MAAPETAGVRFPPPLIFLLGLTASVAIDFLLLGRSLSVPPPPRAALAMLLVIAGGALDVWAIAAFRRAKTTILPWGRASLLVPGGPYRHSRNPMYVGMTLVYAGLAVGLASTTAAILLAPILLVMRFYAIAREERHLEARFGAEYRAYCARVRRWI